MKNTVSPIVLPYLVSWHTDNVGIHDHALALWGTPLGELWDLEELSKLFRLKQLSRSELEKFLKGKYYIPMHKKWARASK